MSKLNWRAVVAELVGTFIFVLLGAGAVLANSYLAYTGSPSPGLVSVAIVHGLVLAVLVSGFGAISGGHFNPAVTIAYLATGRRAPIVVAAYVVAQCMGALLAAGLLRVMFPQVLWDPAHLGAPVLGSGIGFAAGTLDETVLTFILVLAIYGTAVDERAPRTIAGFGVGVTLLVCILVGGPLTGGYLNPARAFGPALVSGYLDNLPAFLIGPILGAVLAALFYEYVFMTDSDMA
jgi:MIP family channel proteins